MQKTTLALVMWGMLLGACAAPHTFVSPTAVPGLTTVSIVSSATADLASAAPPTAPVTHTFAANTPAEPSMTPRPTLSSTAQPMAAPTYPLVAKLCPVHPLVPLGNLGLDSQIRLLILPFTAETVWDEKGGGLFVVSRDHPIPQRVKNLSKVGLTNSAYFNVSPNGQWIVFDRMTIGSKAIRAWISSIDGSQQWALSPQDNLNSGKWLDDNTVALRDSVGNLAKVVDPFTMKQELLTNLPATQIAGIGAILFRDSGRTLMLYQADNNYRLFNVQSQMDRQVLPWLSALDVPLLDKSIYVTSDGKIEMTTARSYGFDVSSLMRIDDLLATSSYTQTMQPVFLPNDILPAYLGQRSGFGVSIYKDIGQDVADGSQFYWYDYEHRMIRDYCFVAYEGAKPSPDDKFVAFTRQHFPGTAPIPKSVIIVNLETGTIAQIDDYQFVSWARAQK